MDEQTGSLAEAARAAGAEVTVAKVSFLMEDYTCPFCREGGPKEIGGGFDKIGLKLHLLNYCEEYEKTEVH